MHLTVTSPGEYKIAKNVITKSACWTVGQMHASALMTEAILVVDTVSVLPAKLQAMQLQQAKAAVRLQ